MNADKNIIKEKLQNLVDTGGEAVVFALGDYYVQAANAAPGELYCEAVSHHYHSSIETSLESGFIAMGFHLEEGGNYSRSCRAGSPDEIDKIADDIVKIFSDLYRAGDNEPFEVTEM
jgi:hypothetical protein